MSGAPIAAAESRRSGRAIWGEFAAWNVSTISLNTGSLRNRSVSSGSNCVPLPFAITSRAAVTERSRS
jgi:hypothetical protein